ncbi:hypothetical protein RN001_013156 [Aquatica leii]|uniref:Uncharacterized protein n=1 Tax=Aquatica leii TaxID=1421715 RepID=A0AAN7S6V7_9COLE|nr:hypothetical protein RN001_013156 [Aquatica leii]
MLALFYISESSFNTKQLQTVYDGSVKRKDKKVCVNLNRNKPAFISEEPAEEIGTKITIYQDTQQTMKTFVFNWRKSLVLTTTRFASR